MEISTNKPMIIDIIGIVFGFDVLDEEEEEEECIKAFDVVIKKNVLKGKRERIN